MTRPGYTPDTYDRLELRVLINSAIVAMTDASKDTKAEPVRPGTAVWDVNFNAIRTLSGSSNTISIQAKVVSANEPVTLTRNNVYTSIELMN